MTGASIGSRVGRLEAQQAHREATCFAALTATKEQPAMPTPDEWTDIATRAFERSVDITRATIRFRCSRHGCALSPATGSRPDSDLFEIRDEAGHAHGPASFTLDLTAALFCPTQFHEHDQRPDGTGGMGVACSADWTVTAENPS